MTQLQLLSCEFYEIFQDLCLIEHIRVATSEYLLFMTQYRKSFVASFTVVHVIT